MVVCPEGNLTSISVSSLFSFTCCKSTPIHSSSFLSLLLFFELCISISHIWACFQGNGNSVWGVLLNFILVTIFYLNACIICMYNLLFSCPFLSQGCLVMLCSFKILSSSFSFTYVMACWGTTWNPPPPSLSSFRLTIAFSLIFFPPLTQRWW